MGQDHIEQHRRYIVISYAFMFLALFTVIFAAFAYLVARKVAVVDNAEVWIHAHALWIMRNGILFLFMSVFAVVWFIPPSFCMEQQSLGNGINSCWCCFSAIAWLFLLNAWLKGLSKYLKNKAVF